MWHLAVREDDLGSAAKMLERYRGEVPWSSRAFLAWAQGDRNQYDGLLEQARGAENRQLQIGARHLMTYRGAFAAADSLLAHELEWRQRPPVRQGSRLMKAWLEIGRGRWQSALAAFRAAEADGAGDARIEAALAAALPFLTVPAADLRDIRSSIGAWRPETDAEAPTALASALRPHLRLFLLGLLSSRLGEPGEAQRYASALEQADPPRGGVRRAKLQAYPSLNSRPPTSDLRPPSSMPDTLDFPHDPAQEIRVSADTLRNLVMELLMAKKVFRFDAEVVAERAWQIAQSRGAGVSAMLCHTRREGFCKPFGSRLHPGQDDSHGRQRKQGDHPDLR